MPTSQAIAQVQPAMILCRCAEAQVIEPSMLSAVEAAFEQTGTNAFVVPDLCAMSAEKDQRLVELTVKGPVTVLACHERAVNWLLTAAGCDSSQVEVLDLRSGSADEIVNRLAEGTPTGPLTVEQALPGAGTTWFPVIDFDRCTHCGQCESFCLFGVYGRDSEGGVIVGEPMGCKDNCPACARVCPEAAIIFPKLDEAPLNGAAIDDLIAVKGPVAVNLDQALGRDLFATLKNRRSKLKRRLLRREALARAEQERCECLDDFQDEAVNARVGR